MRLEMGLQKDMQTINEYKQLNKTEMKNLNLEDSNLIEIESPEDINGGENIFWYVGYAFGAYAAAWSKYGGYPQGLMYG